MTLIPISLLAIILWLGGYFMTAQKMAKTGLLSDELEKIIIPPKWLYFVCGAPVSANYPRGAMRVAAFGVQIEGFALAVFVIWSTTWKPSPLGNMIGIAFAVIFTLIITFYISKHYVANEQKRKKEGSRRDHFRK